MQIEVRSVRIKVSNERERETDRQIDKERGYKTSTHIDVITSHCIKNLPQIKITKIAIILTCADKIAVLINACAGILSCSKSVSESLIVSLLKSSLFPRHRLITSNTVFCFNPDVSQSILCI